MIKVFVGIGSNIERRKNINFGIKELNYKFTNLLCSNIYQTKAVGFPGNDFYNLVVGFDCYESVEILISILKKIEAKAGRKPNALKFCPRTLDIDILLYGNKNYQPKFDIPRDEITKHCFVIKPLAEIAPNIKHPVLTKTFSQIWQEFNKYDAISRVELELNSTKRP